MLLGSICNGHPASKVVKNQVLGGPPRRWIFCFGRIAASPQHRHFFAKLYRRVCRGGRARSRSMATCRVTWPFGFCGAKIRSGKYVEVRSNQYLKNLIEQDHRAIKRRCAAMVGGSKSFRSAAITLAGIELAHRIRKRQFSFGRGRYHNFGSLKQIWIEHSPNTSPTSGSRC